VTGEALTAVLLGMILTGLYIFARLAWRTPRPTPGRRTAIPPRLPPGAHSMRICVGCGEAFGSLNAAATDCGRHPTRTTS
jgi:hypothetical protein